MTRNKLIRYNPELKKKARELRTCSTFSEVLLWLKIKRKSLGYEFHRQVAIDAYIVDFYCHELKLAIEIDGSSHDHNFDYDYMRQRRLEELGVKLIRFADKAVKRNMTEVLRALETAIQEMESTM